MTATENETTLPPGYSRCPVCKFLNEPELDRCPACFGQRLLFADPRTVTPAASLAVEPRPVEIGACGSDRPFVAVPCGARLSGVRFVRAAGRG